VTRPASLPSDEQATADARRADPALLRREFIQPAGADAGPYWQDWYCDPPPGPWLLDHDEDWARGGPGGYPVRRIRSVTPVAS
jgi:hypothetical protein